MLGSAFFAGMTSILVKWRETFNKVFFGLLLIVSGTLLILVKV